MRLCPLALLLLALGACSDKGGDDDDDDEGDTSADPGPSGTPDITLSTTEIDFGKVPVSYYTSRAVTVTNDGDGDLELLDVELAGSGAFTIDDDGEDVVAPGAFTQVAVTYTPPSATSDTATITISSDDPDEGSLTVTLQGMGVNQQ